MACSSAAPRAVARGTHPRPDVYNGGDEKRTSGLVVLMHGLGDTSAGWADVADALADALPHVKFVLPTARTQPVSLNGGASMPSWYDIVGLSDRASETCDGIDDSRAYVAGLIREHAPPGGASRVVLGGFSQGGALALYAGLQMDGEPLAGVFCLSGYLPNARAFRVAPRARSTPVWMAHGTSDEVVRYELAVDTERELRERGVASLTLSTYRGMGHHVVPEELRDLLGFVKRALPAAASDRTRETDGGGS